MMNYQRLGEYIREVNVRNSELKVTNLLGLSIEKKFIPSIANTIGADMSVYKIVRPMQKGATKRNRFLFPRCGHCRRLPRVIGKSHQVPHLGNQGLNEFIRKDKTIERRISYVLLQRKPIGTILHRPATEAEL